MFAEVIVDITNIEVDKIFEYSIPNDSVKVGSRVLVPFGKKNIEGIVIAINETCKFDEDKIKPIIKVLEDTPALTDEILSLMNFMCDKYYITRASALRLFLPSEMRNGKIKEQYIKYVKIADNFNIDEFILSLRKSAIKQKECLEFLLENKKDKLSNINNNFGASAVKSLIEKGALTIIEEQNIRLPYKDLLFKDKAVTLTDKQNEVISGIKNTDKLISLLYGVTGSGKTEVYLKLINDTLNQDKTAIMLVPEIALTPQMLKQLRAKFGDYAAILHSGLSAGERFDEWWRLRNGDAKIAIGARSAIFAPLSNVGVIIIDEEHDGSYISESNPRFNTIDIATFRAKYNNAKLVLGSATPSVDSFMLAKNRVYNLESMPDRINKKPLPLIEVVDMRKEVRKGNNTFFSGALKSELEKCLNSGNQAMIFLNQRGYSKSVICTECGHVQKCEACDVSLTYHREDNSLLCHYCGAKYKMISACTECGSPYLRYGGIGTERIVDDIQKLFPNAKILRMDRDSTQNKEGHFKILTEFAERKADILVGTQMIAKGHDFPFVTLVGILDADQSLHFSDYRSNERTFQLLTQVAGRCGRAENSGIVVLQTYSPENNVILQAINYNYDAFFNSEISIRKATGFPPYSDIVRVLISNKDEDNVIRATKAIYNELSTIYSNNKDKFRFFGCMKAPLKRLQNQFRYQVLMRIDKDDKKLLDEIYYSSIKYNNKGVTVYMELNPNNLS